MTAQDYPVTFPYGATTPPYSPARPHKGNDRKMVIGIPVIVGGVQIGLSGNTGLSSGSHLHTQAGTDLACQNTFNPLRLEFKEGVVVNIRTVDEKQWGKFVTVQVGNEFITYAHLSRIDVKVGDKLTKGDEMKPTEQQVKDTIKGWLKYDPSPTQIKNYTNSYWWVLMNDVIPAYAELRVGEEAKVLPKGKYLVQ